MAVGNPLSDVRRWLGIGPKGFALLVVQTVLLFAAWRTQIGLENEIRACRDQGMRRDIRAEVLDSDAYCGNEDFVHECGRRRWGYEWPLAAPTDTNRHAFDRLPDGVVDFNVAKATELWQSLKTFAVEKRRVSPWLPNGMMPLEDEYLLYAIIRHFKPKRVVEVGSGYSTKTAYMALSQNPGASEQTCIEPFRAHVVKEQRKFWEENLTATMGSKAEVKFSLHEKVVQNCTFEACFSQLRENDVLWIDSSHVTAPYGDTLYELLWILPRLQKGVIVHVHDICLPEQYPKEWLHGQQRVYTEQWMLAALLNGNENWEVLWGNWKMALDHPELFREIGLPGDPHGSIWLRKTR